MLLYVVVSLFLIILGLFYDSLNSAASLHGKKVPIYIFIVPSFIVLFFISTFRGDFTTDYTNYSILFELYNRHNISDIFNLDFNQEIGYIFLNMVIGIFTTDQIYLFAVTTFIILFGFYHQFYKYSVNIWLSVLMFVTVGSYYASFNITRQILAAAIIFIGSKFLYERKFFKFLLVVLIASTFHMSALIMIPFYFVLNFRLNLKNLLFILIGSGILVVLFDNILSYLQLFIYTNYTESAWGMTGQNVTNVALPIALLVFSVFNIKKLDSKNDSMHRIWFNAVIFYALFNILGLQVEMVERVSRFFASYALLLIPFIFSKMKDKNLRIIYMLILIAGLFLYNYIILSDSVFDPYYFIWDK